MPGNINVHCGAMCSSKSMSSKCECAEDGPRVDGVAGSSQTLASIFSGFGAARSSFTAERPKFRRACTERLAAAAGVKTLWKQLE
jgi:hypothetical protein